MSLPTIDLNAIFWGAVIDCIISTAIFVIFKIKNLTAIITIVITFVIPTFSIMFYAQSVNFDINKTVPAMSDWITAYMYNFVAWLLSCLFGFIINSVIYTASGGRTEVPEW
jgi:hypothetical protein